MQTILAIDDEVTFLSFLKENLELDGFSVETLSNPLQAESAFRSKSYDCVLLDVGMPGVDGIEVLKDLHKINPAVPVIMLSGQSTIKTAVNALKLGACDFIEKLKDENRLASAIKNAIDKYAWKQEKQTLLAEIAREARLVGDSEPMQKIYSKINMLSKSDTKVLILGETGTGKELVARALHYRSPRAGKPYIRLNCACIPDTLLESELFGHKKGAFTGADKDKAGKFQLADGGTIFLDEISEMDLNLQAKLLHVLQDGEIQVLGAEENTKVDVRVIAATNRKLEDLVNQGKFRQDLYYRLNVAQISIPPLKERKEDIVTLARYFLNKFAQKYNKVLTDLSPQAVSVLINYSWPGNVRQLENIIEKVAIFADRPTIASDQITESLFENNHREEIKHSASSLREEMENHEREYILKFLRANQWKIQQAAKQLNIDRSALYKKMRKLNIVKPNGD